MDHGPQDARAVSGAAQSTGCAISVIVPTRNRKAQLRLCLAALADQTYAADRFEVVVVDDGSDDPLDAVVAPFGEQLRVRLIRQSNAGPARARNVGASHATGAWLAFTDDDCAPQADWLLVLEASARRWPDRLLGGHTVNALPDNLYAAASQLLVDYLYDYYDTAAATSGAGPATPPFFTSNNILVPARLFHAVGGFAESFPLAAGEDRELCDRWHQHGHHLLRVPSAVVRHAHGLSLGRFWRQHFNYGRGAWHLRRARLLRQRPPLRIEPLAFYWRLLTYPWRTAGSGTALPLVALLWLSQMANTMGFVSEKYRGR